MPELSFNAIAEFEEFLTAEGLESHAINTFFIAGSVNQPPPLDGTGTLSATDAYRAPFAALMAQLSKQMGVTYRLRFHPKPPCNSQVLLAAGLVSDPDRLDGFLENFRSVWEAAPWTGELLWLDSRLAGKAHDLLRPHGYQEFSLWTYHLTKPEPSGASEV